MNTRIRFLVGPLSLALLISPASALEYHYTADLYPSQHPPTGRWTLIAQITLVEPLSSSRRTA